MQCPNCHAEVRDGAAFCGSCGATIDQPSAPAVTTPPPQPTTPMPAPAVPDQSAYDQAVYAQQMAEYERQKAAYDQAQYAQQQAAYAGQYAQQPAAAPPKKKTGCVVAVIILIVLLIGCSVGGFFAYRALKDKAEEALEITTPDTGDSESGETGDGTGGNLLDSYATAEEAVRAQLDASGSGDWVSQVYDEGDGYATYWAGPPNSEFVDQIYVEQNADGTWSVIEVTGIEYGGDVSEGGGGAADEAMSVVDQHLSYVMSDMGLEAQSLTIDPFRSDAAAAQVSAGGFDSYSIDGYEEQSDGTFWVQTTQSWYGGPAEGWEYYVVPTEAGYRIANIEYMQ